MIEATVKWRKGGSAAVCAESWEELFRLLGNGDYISLIARAAKSKAENEPRENE